MKGRAPLFSSQTPSWATPEALYAELDREFGFNLDPCPLNDAAIWDGKALSWSGRRVYCNPPYGRGIGDWLAKAREADVAVFLVPARTDTRWWHDYAMHADEIRFVRGRLKFSGAKFSAPFPNAILIYRAGAMPPGGQDAEGHRRTRDTSGVRARWGGSGNAGAGTASDGTPHRAPWLAICKHCRCLYAPRTP